jgi:ApbE superfamily uncharacterized protein (UPF0280 family)
MREQANPKNMNTQRKAKNIVCAVGGDIRVKLLDVKVVRLYLSTQRLRCRILFKSFEKKIPAKCTYVGTCLPLARRKGGDWDPSVKTLRGPRWVE